MTLSARQLAIIDILLNVDRNCADLDRGFRSDGRWFRFDYGEERFLVSAALKEALRQQYRAQTRKSASLVIAAALGGLGLAIGADLVSGPTVPVWFNLGLLLAPLIPACWVFWRNEMRTWNDMIAQMRRHSADAKALAPGPTP